MDRCAVHLKKPAPLVALHPIWATPSGSDAPRIVVDPGEDRLCNPSGPAGFDSAIERNTLPIGPIQLVVVGFEHPDFQGQIIAELERLRENDTVRVIDALAIHKDVAGGIEVARLSNLSRDEAIEVGSTIGALIGLGAEGEGGAEAGAIAGAEAAAEGAEVFSDEDAWDVLEEIPNDSAAALILLEHHWAVPLRDAIARTGGFRISDGFISPLDLVEIGLLAEDDTEAHALPGEV
jgi:uncharacterized membrane protein